MGYNQGFDVSPEGSAGELSLWWDSSMKIQVSFSSKSVIDSSIKRIGPQIWTKATWVYGTRDMLWFCGGYFIEFLWDYEK